VFLKLFKLIDEGRCPRIYIRLMTCLHQKPLDKFYTTSMDPVYIPNLGNLNMTRFGWPRL
jgi:hypothetical protein